MKCFNPLEKKWFLVHQAQAFTEAPLVNSYNDEEVKFLKMRHWFLGLVYRIQLLKLFVLRFINSSFMMTIPCRWKLAKRLMDMWNLRKKFYGRTVEYGDSLCQNYSIKINHAQTGHCRNSCKWWLSTKCFRSVWCIWNTTVWVWTSKFIIFIISCSRWIDQFKCEGTEPKWQYYLELVLQQVELKPKRFALFS